MDSGSILAGGRKGLGGLVVSMRKAQKGKSHMKSLAELQAIRDRAKMAVNVRENSKRKHVFWSA